MVTPPLTTDQIEEFVERGWTLLPHALSPSVARAVRHDLGRRIGIDLERPEQWGEPRVWLQEIMTGTLLVEDSDHLAARNLWDAEPTGLEADDFSELLTAILDERGWPGVAEVVAEEGDVVLAHPLLFHASNPNHGTRPRVMAQPAFSLREPMRAEGTELFPVEIPLARARP